jgi:ABC-type transport system involved in Fe-S cluster assembly fused permease/ATPase subunit
MSTALLSLFSVSSSRSCHQRTIVRNKRCLCNRRRNLAPVASSSSKVGRYAVAQSSDYSPPSTLPPAPPSSSLNVVLPFLLQLAISEKQLYWRLAVALALLLLSKTAGIMAPLYFKQAVDALALGGSQSQAVPACVAAVLLFGAARCILSLAKEVQHPIFSPVSQAVARRVSHHSFRHVLELDLGFHLDRKTGSLSRILERGARSVGMIFRAVVFTFIPTAIELVAVCVLLARAFSPKISYIVLCTFGVYTGFTVFLTWLATSTRRAVKNLDNEISSQAVDALLNVETVQLYANERLEAEKYDAGLTAYQRASVKLEVISAILNAGQAVILAGGMTVAMVAAAQSVGITSGGLVYIQTLLLQLWAPLQFLGWFYRELRQSLVDMEDLFEILRRNPALPDGFQDLPSSSNQEGVAVQLQNVRYKYPGAGGKEVLKGVNIEARPGEKIAIVGPSGSGKSTLLRLLVRMYDTDDGAVLLDGLDVKSLHANSIRHAVAVVPQDTVLFNDSVYNNIAYGKVGSCYDEVVQAARAAKLDTAVKTMTGGYDTVVGERGLKLSGGEKQRVSLARAFLRSPRLLICDEATSALDTATERSIMTSLTELAAGRTSVFVAHRLSTVQECDRIYVLSEGEVKEEGGHGELMARRGMYYDMWNAQEAAEAAENSLHGSLFNSTIDGDCDVEVKGFEIGESEDESEGQRIAEVSR